MDANFQSPEVDRSIRVRINVSGIVQGVGFRPFVYRLATGLNLAGWVLNDTNGVTVEVQGPRASVERFASDLQRQPPPLAVVDMMQALEVPTISCDSFVILGSEEGGGFVPVSPDVATCPDCLRELFDPFDRRFRYPFINCTSCGPRFTIVEGVPYDRPRTSMSGFAMCPTCRSEYDDPADRRFHAQPNACPVCGPQVWLRPTPRTDGLLLEGDAAVVEAQRLLSRGRILAIKGLGGFHLACDAMNGEAVAELRRRKRRVGKPFAIMVPDLAAARRLCALTRAEEDLLSSPQRPIVLLSRGEGCAVASDVAPGQRRLGVMLPYTPLHHLLFEERAGAGFHALVMTSGNVSDEPIAIDNDEALSRLADVADFFLVHDRDIRVRCDDSVAQLVDGRPVAVRRSRGYAPSPIRLPFDLAPVLACGAELKNAFCLAKGRYAFLSQHIGDMENAETLAAFEEGVERYKALFHVTPQIVAHDLHPDYLSTRYALDLAGRDPALRLAPVQHHHAHLASCMAENGLEGRVIGVTWDGTGYGLDGAVWGGEFLVGDYRDVERVAHFRYVRLAGGDVATRRPHRSAMSYLRHSFGPTYLDIVREHLGRVDATEVAVVDRLLETGLNSPLTSSAGRLFDAVAALLGVGDVVTYEAQAAIELEMLAGRHDARRYEVGFEPGADGLVIDVALMIRQIVEEIRRSEGRDLIATRFHNTLSWTIGEACERIRGETGLERVCLSGGVFQNQRLMELVLPEVRGRGFQVFIQRHVPANDGGLALGQVLVADARTRR